MNCWQNDPGISFWALVLGKETDAQTRKRKILWPRGGIRTPDLITGWDHCCFTDWVDETLSRWNTLGFTAQASNTVTQNISTLSHTIRFCIGNFSPNSFWITSWYMYTGSVKMFVFRFSNPYHVAQSSNQEFSRSTDVYVCFDPLYKARRQVTEHWRLERSAAVFKCFEYVTLNKAKLRTSFIC